MMATFNYTSPGIGYYDRRYVKITGDTMTGLLTLSGVPTADLHAATKKYVDDNTPSMVWGSITGTLSDQTDLQDELDLKLNLTGGTLGAGLIVNNDSGSGAINDFQVNSDTQTAILVDASADTLTIGVPTTGTDITLTGNLVIPDDGLFGATNTANYFWMGDGANYNPVTPAAAVTGLGLDAGGAGDIWVEKAGDTMTGTNSTTFFQIQQADTTPVFNVDTTNGRVGIGTDSPTCTLHIAGSSDAIQSIIQAHSTQTSNLQEWQNSGGTVNATVGSEGNFSISTGSNATASVQTNTSLVVNRAFDSGGSATQYASRYSVSVPAAITGAMDFRAFSLEGYLYNTGAVTGSLFGGKMYISHVGSGSTNTVVGYTAGIKATNASSTITTAKIFNAEDRSGAGTITNNYGYYADNQTAGTNNYAIYTNAGTIHAGDKIEFTQTDGNEAIDSLADGYLDYRATTAHRFGDGTNQTLIASDGRMTLEGTARHWIGFEIDNTGFKEPTSQTATKVNRGLGTAYAYADGSTEHIHATMRITGRWDDTENIEVILIWETPTTSADCYWDVKYQIKGNDEDMTDVTTTSCAEHVKESSATANGLIHSTFTIPTAAFDAGDKILSLEIYRLGAEVTDTLGAIAYLHKMIVRGIANNLGGVVS